MAVVVFSAPLISQTAQSPPSNSSPLPVVKQPLAPVVENQRQHERPIESQQRKPEPNPDQAVATKTDNDQPDLPPATIRIDQYFVRTVSGDLYRRENQQPLRPVRRQIFRLTKFVDQEGRVYMGEVIPREQVALHPERTQ